MKIDKQLIIFETALLLGLVNFFVEKWIFSLDINFYLKVLSVMMMVAGSFSIVFKLIEPLAKGAVKKMLIFGKKSYVNLIIHTGIIGLFFILYSWLFFGVKVI
jgi:hypothetical protein